MAWTPMAWSPMDYYYYYYYYCYCFHYCNYCYNCNYCYCYYCLGSTRWHHCVYENWTTGGTDSLLMSDATCPGMNHSLRMSKRAVQASR